MIKLSLAMIVKNEAAVLNRCLDSVRHLVDEIIIVDTGSTDRTKEIAQTHGAKIFDYTWNNSFADARNFALAQSSGDWNLVLDADEFISNDCSDELRAFMSNGPAIGRLKIVNKFEDKNGVAYANSYISRLFPKGHKYTGRIHEQVDSDLPRVKLAVEVQHDGYYCKTKSDRNIPILQLEIKEQPASPYYHYQIAKEYRGLENFEFAYRHLKNAYQLLSRKELYYPNVVVDFMYAIMKTGYITDGIEVVENESARLHDFADYQFVLGQFYMELIMSNPEKYIHLMPRIEEAYQACLQIGETDKYDNVTGTGSYSALHNLGVYYEVTGNAAAAKQCYQKAAEYDYAPSIARLAQF